MGMTKIISALAAFALLAFSNLAGAQLFRAYVSSTGNDSNPCSLPSPCRLLPRALTVVAGGGEIWMLDSANFNTTTVDIDKSVTILAIPGAVGSVVAPSFAAINIATPGVKVVLRNLVIGPPPGGAPLGTSGIVMSAGTSLTVEGCQISRMSQFGLRVATPAMLTFVESSVRQSGQEGLLLNGGASATIARSYIQDNGGTGVRIDGNLAASAAKVTILGSVLSNNAGGGVLAQNGSPTQPMYVTVRDNHISHGTVGLWADSVSGQPTVLTASGNQVVHQSTVGMWATGAGAKIVASANVVSNNATGFSASGGGTFLSQSNNVLTDNDTPSIGTIGTFIGQ